MQVAVTSLPALIVAAVALADCTGSAPSAVPDATVTTDAPDVPTTHDLPTDTPPEGGCVTDQDCTGGDFCNGILVCTAAHQCGYALIHNPCNDGQPCTDDTCNSAAQTCAHTPHNDRCPMGEICEAFAGCVPPDGG